MCYENKWHHERAKKYPMQKKCQFLMLNKEMSVGITTPKMIHGQQFNNKFKRFE